MIVYGKNNMGRSCADGKSMLGYTFTMYTCM